MVIPNPHWLRHKFDGKRNDYNIPKTKILKLAALKLPTNTWKQIGHCSTTTVIRLIEIATNKMVSLVTGVGDVGFILRHIGMIYVRWGLVAGAVC